MRPFSTLIPLVAGLLIALTYLLVQGTAPDATQHERTVDALRTVILYNAALQRDVLRARTGLLRSYDPLVHSLAKLRQAADDLTDCPGCRERGSARRHRSKDRRGKDGSTRSGNPHRGFQVGKCAAPELVELFQLHERADGDRGRQPSRDRGARGRDASFCERSSVRRGCGCHRSTRPHRAAARCCGPADTRRPVADLPRPAYRHDAAES